MLTAVDQHTESNAVSMCSRSSFLLQRARCWDIHRLVRLIPTFYRENGLYNSSTRKSMPSLTKCTKIMPEGSIVLYFQMRIFLVFQNVAIWRGI